MKDVFFGGIPTEPDVKAIREAFPDTSLRKGQIIEYETIANLIGTDRNSSRFRTVTNRWRAVVENDTGSTVISTERGVGFKVLDEVQKVDLGHSKLRTATRSARRSYIVTARVNPHELSSDERQRLTHLQNRSAGFLAAMQVRGRLTDDSATRG